MLIGRNLYHQAIEAIFKKIGYEYQRLALCKILVNKSGRKLYIEVAGKNLPYSGNLVEEAFPWETHIQPHRLDRIEMEAEKYLAESWIAFCYAILQNKYKQYFSTIVTLEGVEFGTKLLKTISYRNHMKPRSPSWSAVDLPREKVTQITHDPESI